VLKLSEEKVAILGELLAGPLGHLTANAMGRAAHHSSNLADMLAHQGLQHSLTGSKINAGAMRSIKSLAGPEAMGAYDAAHALGSRVAHLPTEQQRQIFQAASTAGSHPALGEAPLLGSLHRAVGHELAGTAPVAEAKGLAAKLYSKGVGAMSRIVNTPFDTGLQRAAKSAVGIAPLATAAATHPIGTAAHAAVNGVREVAGNSQTGQKVMKNMFQKGLNGSVLSPGVEKAIDYVVSPAVLDPLRVGQAFRKVSPEAATHAASMIPNGIPGVMPGGMGPPR